MIRIAVGRAGRAQRHKECVVREGSLEEAVWSIQSKKCSGNPLLPL